jgi:hypothetical protein
MGEVVYKDIPGYPGYRVGDDGSIWRRWVNCRWGRKLTDTWRPMKLCVGAKGYLRVNLVPPEGGTYKTFRVHRLVLLAFVGPGGEGQECRHLDGNKTDNRLSNLAWGTAEENRDDIRKHGGYQSGEDHSGRKLTEGQVREIRELYASGGHLLRELADRFAVSLTNVAAIVSRRSWKHVA